METETIKNTCVIYAPVDTYSGYGANARDRIEAIIKIKSDEWDIKIIPCRWGLTPTNFLQDNKERWGYLREYFIERISTQPDIMIWVTIPSEAQAWGKWNCLFTAGIETTFCDPSWIDGINRMDLTIVPSEFSKKIILESRFEERDKSTNNTVREVKVNKPIEVLFEGVSSNKFYPIEWK